MMNMTNIEKEQIRERWKPEKITIGQSSYLVNKEATKDILSLLAANDELEKDKARLIRWESKRETDLRQRIATLEREKAKQRDKISEFVRVCADQAKYLELEAGKVSELEKRVKELEHDLANAHASVASQGDSNGRRIYALEKEVEELRQSLADKNHTANVFMNQVRKLQRKEEEMKGILKTSVSHFRHGDLCSKGRQFYDASKACECGIDSMISKISAAIDSAAKEDKHD